MRLIHKHIIEGISKDDCRVIIDDLKGHVAVGLEIGKCFEKRCHF